MSKPSVHIDESGVVLRVTGPDGEPWSIPLEASTIFEALAALTRAGNAVKTREGRKVLFHGLGRLLQELSK